MQTLLAALEERILILDGAMGTMLQQNGLMPGECPELFGMEHPEVLEDIHRQYVEAGSDIIQTNTFGGNRFKLSEYGLAERVREINAEAVRIARRAVGSQGWVAVSIGPTGQLLKPMGQVDFDDLYLAFKEQISAAAEAGADIISIETMTDIGELRAAVIAAHDSCQLPILAHLTFEEGGRTMMGTDPVTAAVILEALSPLAIGANCSGGAAELCPLIEQMGQYTNYYLSVEPNAGLPRLVDGKTVFPDSPDFMAEWALRLREAGANIIGGCCGSTPQHIKAIAQMLKGLPPVKRQVKNHRALASRTSSIFIDQGNLKYIGERINPTARKKLAAEIKAGQMGMVLEEARKQVAAGAPVLDVNMGVPGIDEPAAMQQAVEMLQSTVTVPLSLDTTNPAALEAGLKGFVGRALINSTTGETKALDTILPLAKKYGAAVLGLCLDENGIPNDTEGRMQVARKIYQRARHYGLRDVDIYLDGLVKTASAEQDQVMETLKTITAIKAELGVGTVLGVSNVSHGLPAREILNSAYLAMAWSSGLDLPIMNPFDERMQEVTRAAGVLLNRDAYAAGYIDCYRDGLKLTEKAVSRSPICQHCNIPDLVAGSPVKAPAAKPALAEKPETAEISGVYQAVVTGDQNKVTELLDQELNKGTSAIDLVNRHLIPAIEEVGRRYDRKEYFLPQLMRSAETMKTAFNHLRPRLAEGGQTYIGTVILATVQGDIHDIGKNIVAVMMENYGFRVIDLGKDVPAAAIVETARKEKADIIGLSALMTTTMPRMAEIIALVREQDLRVKIMVGGAVLTDEYAAEIGADAYSRDARDAAVKARNLMGNQ